MKKRKGKKRFRIGDIITCSSIYEMERTIKLLADEGVDAKPIGYKYKIEILDIDKRR